MEAWTNTVLRASQTRCQQGSGGANGRQSPRPLADRELSRSEHCFAERLLCSAGASAAGRTLLAISAEPPYADPHVRWCGRGEWATIPPMPIVCRGCSTVGGEGPLHNLMEVSEAQG